MSHRRRSGGARSRRTGNRHAVGLGSGRRAGCAGRPPKPRCHALGAAHGPGRTLGRRHARLCAGRTAGRRGQTRGRWDFASGQSDRTARRLAFRAADRSPGARAFRRRRAAGLCRTAAGAGCGYRRIDPRTSIAPVPGAASGNFVEFGESLYRYGYQAGMLFAKRQGGPYAGRRATELVDWIRGQGIRGVGQSSWGPTIFALLADAQMRQRLFRARPPAICRSTARGDGRRAGQPRVRVETL